MQKCTTSWCIPAYTCGSSFYSTHVQNTDQRQSAYIGEAIYYANVIWVITCMNYNDGWGSWESF